MYTSRENYAFCLLFVLDSRMVCHLVEGAVTAVIREQISERNICISEIYHRRRMERNY
jgi:hypothetical protein